MFKDLRSNFLLLRHADVHSVCRSAIQTSQTHSSTWHEGRGRQRQVARSTGATEQPQRLSRCSAVLHCLPGAMQGQEAARGHLLTYCVMYMFYYSEGPHRQG